MVSIEHNNTNKRKAVATNEATQLPATKRSTVDIDNHVTSQELLTGSRKEVEQVQDISKVMEGDAMDTAVGNGTCMNETTSVLAEISQIL